MKKNKVRPMNTQQEVNLKEFLQRVYNNKWPFISSICSFVVIALIYILLANPKYEVSTSILIDPLGKSRDLGESKYIEGEVSLIEMEKNLYNEIGIIKSFSLISQTVQDLGLDISYFGRRWLKAKEHYKDIPFEVNLVRTEPQLFNIPFEIQILANDRYRLSIEANKFEVSNPSTDSSREVRIDLDFSRIYKFGEKVEHNYFNFIIKKPKYKVDPDEFKDVDFSFIVRKLDDVVDDYMSKLEVNNIDIQASIFNIVSYGPVVDKEINFLNGLTENYVKNKLVSRNKIATDKETFIRNQLKIISDSLSKAELALEKFKKDKRALNLGETATNALGKTSNLQVERAKLRLNIGYYNSLIENVEANRNSDDFIIPITAGVKDPLINENIMELKRLYSERSKKRFFVTDNNQEIQILNNQINESTQLLLNNLRNAIKSSELALRRVNSLLSNYDEVIDSLPMQENQLLSIQRQSTLYENLFNYLSQELAKTGIARAENISDTRVLDTARMVGDGPIAPQKMLLLVLAIILGTTIPLAWLVFFVPNDIIQNTGQIMAYTDIPVIANIAHHNTEPKNGNSEVSDWRLKESFRDLSANLKFVNSKKGCAVLGIGSIMPKEGKTFCAINLGITFAELGKKTLIIDTDLRNPSLVDANGKIEGKGLSNYLQGEITNLKEIINSHEKLSNLHFIPTSVVDDGSIHGLISGDKMKSLIHECSEKYDYIILDTPPSGLVSDYILFSNLIDINLFVVRRNIAKLAFLKDFEKLMLHGKKKKSYIILNDVIEKYHKYGYGQMYGAQREAQLINDSLSI